MNIPSDYGNRFGICRLDNGTRAAVGDCPASRVVRADQVRSNATVAEVHRRALDSRVHRDHLYTVRAVWPWIPVIAHYCVADLKTVVTVRPPGGRYYRPGGASQS